MTPRPWGRRKRCLVSYLIEWSSLEGFLFGTLLDWKEILPYRGHIDCRIIESPNRAVVPRELPMLPTHPATEAGRRACNRV